MTQARAAAPVSSAAAEAAIGGAADVRGPATDQLECQQFGGCEGREDSAAGRGKLLLGAGEDSRSSSSPEEDSTVDAGSDDWIHKFLKEYEKASRFCVTNYSLESEGFDFGEDECEGEAEVLSSDCGIGVIVTDSASDDANKEDNTVQTLAPVNRGEEKVTALQESAQVTAFSCENSNSGLLDTSSKTSEGNKAGIVCQQPVGENSVEQKCEPDVNSADFVTDVDCCQAVSNELDSSQLPSPVQEQCQDAHNSNTAVVLDRNDSENSSSLTTKSEHSSCSSIVACVERSEGPDSLQRCTNNELSKDSKDRVAQAQLNSEKVDLLIPANSGSSDCVLSPCLIELAQQCHREINNDSTTLLCNRLDSESGAKNNVFVATDAVSSQPHHERVDCQNNDTPKISFEHSECKKLEAGDACDCSNSNVLHHQMKTKPDSPQEQTLVMPINEERREGVIISEEVTCRQPSSVELSNNEKQLNSSDMLCQESQLKCADPTANFQFQSNNKSNTSISHTELGNDDTEKANITLGNISGYSCDPGVSSNVTTSTENLEAHLGKLPLQNGSKTEAHFKKSEHHQNNNTEHGDNISKLNDELILLPENVNIDAGSSKNTPKGLTPEFTGADFCNDKTKVSQQRINEDLPSTSSGYSHDLACGGKLNISSEFHQSSLGSNSQCHNEDYSQQSQGFAQASEKGYSAVSLKGDTFPAQGFPVAKRRSDLLREQFFANNICRSKNGIGIKNSQAVNQPALYSKDGEKESSPEVTVTNERYQDHSSIGAARHGTSGKYGCLVKDDYISSSPCTRVKTNLKNSVKPDTVTSVECHSDNVSDKRGARTLAEKPKKSQRPSSKDKSSKRLHPSLRSHKEALLARVTHQQTSLKHSPPPLVLLNGAAVDLAQKSVQPNGPADTRLNSQLFQEVHELFSEFATPTLDAKSESICSTANGQLEMPCHSSSHLKQHRMSAREQNGSRSSSESATPTNDDPWVLSFSDKDVLQASCKVNCKICRKPYSDPRILPCLHTFCARCLDKCESYKSPSDVECNGDANEFPSKNQIPDARRSRTISPSPDKNVCHQNRRSPSSSPSKFHRSTIHHIATAASSESSNLSTSSSSCSSSNLERNRTILCPSCDAEVDLPAQGAYFLPINFIVKKQLLDAAGEKLGDRLGCDLCCSDSDASSTHCKDCGINMCSFCSEAHKRQRKTSSHQVVSLEEAKTKGSINKSTVILCPVHPLEELKLFCKTCVQTLCRDCVIVGHRDHNCLFISEASDEQTELLKAVLDKLKPQTVVFKELLANLHASSKRVDVQAEHVWEQVNTFIDSYIQALQLHRKNLLSQIRKIKCQKQESLTLYRIQLEQALEDLESSVSFASQILRLGSEVEFLTLLGPVLQRLRELGKVNINHELQNDESISFNPFDKAGLVQGFPVLGTVSEKQAVPCECIVKGDGLLTARQGQRSDVFLITRYPDGSLKKQGGENVQAEMISRDTPSKSIPVNVIDCQDGSYLITFCSDATGFFLLHVTLDGKPVQGSPFVIPVKPKLRQHSGVFHCCSFCSSGGSKEARCACGGTMLGGYKGCGHGHSSHPGSKHWSCCGKTVEKSDCSRPTSATYQFTL